MVVGNYEAPHRNLTTFLIEKEPDFGAHRKVPGLTVPGKIAKMGYKGVDTTELILQDVRVPATRVLGGRAGQGFYHMMDGVEVGRVNVAARGCGVALRAFAARSQAVTSAGEAASPGTSGVSGTAAHCHSRPSVRNTTRSAGRQTASLPSPGTRARPAYCCGYERAGRPGICHPADRCDSPSDLPHRH